MKRATRKLTSRNRAGFTLVEALIATSILTLSVVALSEALIATYSAESSVRREEQAMLLAKDLAEQIAAKPLSADEMPSQAPASDAVAMRSDGTGTTLDAGDPMIVDGNVFRAPSSMGEMADVDAVDGATDTVPAAVATDHPAYGDYTRTVTVTRHKTPDGPVDATGQLRCITVTVTDPGGREHKVSRIVLPVTME